MIPPGFCTSKSHTHIRVKKDEVVVNYHKNTLRFKLNKNLRHLLDEFQHILVINKFYVTPVDLFFGIIFLLHFEDVL